LELYLNEHGADLQQVKLKIVELTSYLLERDFLDEDLAFTEQLLEETQEKKKNMENDVYIIRKDLLSLKERNKNNGNCIKICEPNEVIQMTLIALLLTKH